MDWLRSAGLQCFLPSWLRSGRLTTSISSCGSRSHRTTSQNRHVHTANTYNHKIHLALTVAAVGAGFDWQLSSTCFFLERQPSCWVTSACWVFQNKTCVCRTCERPEVIWATRWQCGGNCMSQTNTPLWAHRSYYKLISCPQCFIWSPLLFQCFFKKADVNRWVSSCLLTR